MKLKTLFLFLCMLSILFSNAQSTFTKKYSVEGVQALQLDFKYTFSVEIIGTDLEEITLDFIAEGEYENNILIKTNRLEDRIIIEDALQPFSSDHNDKLSAHKVYAAVAKLKVPKHLMVFLTVKTGTFTVEGHLHDLQAQFESGDFFLQSYRGNVKIDSLHGNILVYTENATITASSKTGKVINQVPKGKYNMALKTISGDISVYKIK